MTTRIDGSASVLAAVQARMAVLKGRADAAVKDVFANAQNDERVKRAKDALAAMTQATDEARARRKADARAKVERLKQELDMLRRFAGGDPKMIARQAARIARELASAAKEYASGGESRLADLSADGNDTATADTASPNEAAAADGEAATESDAQAAEREAGQLAAEARDTPQTTGEKAKAGQDAAPPDAAKANGQQAKTDARPLDPEQQRQQTVAAFQARAAAIEARGKDAKADIEFVTQVKALFNSARTLVEQMRRRAKVEGRDDREYEGLMKDVKDAGADIADSFGASAGGTMLPLRLMV